MAGAKESLWTRSGISPVPGDPLARGNRCPPSGLTCCEVDLCLADLS